MTQDNKPQESKEENKKPQDNSGVMMTGHIKIFDPETGEVIVDKRNAIHYENMSQALANSLANKSTGFVHEMAFGNGGTTVDTTGVITYLTPNSTGTNATLYNQTYYTAMIETTIHNDFAMFSEKEAKPIVAKRPFIIFGACRQLEAFRSLGFKTFSKVVDESYDLVEDKAERWHKALDSMVTLTEKDPKEVYSQLEGVLTHNKNHFENMNVNFLIIAWRGFSGNLGKPTEEGLYNDARSAIKWLENRGVMKKDIVVYGESLGTGVATEITQNNNFGGIILESPFTSMIDAAKNKYPIFPIKFLLKDKYENDKKIKNIKSPILIMHGRVDKIVPFWMGEKIYNMANEPKYSYFTKYDNHMMEYEENLLIVLKKFIESLN